MITVFLKSTVRPCASVRRPSSRICRSVLNTSGCAFSISSKSTTRERLAAHGLGELAAFVVADVAGRRADQPRHRVLLHVLGHVELDQRVLVAEEELGERLGSSVFPTPEGPRKMNEPDGRFGSLRPARVRRIDCDTA